MTWWTEEAIQKVEGRAFNSAAWFALLFILATLWFLISAPFAYVRDTIKKRMKVENGG